MPLDPQHGDKELSQLSRLGVSGRIIAEHRARRRLSLPPGKLLTILLLPLIFNLAVGVAIDQIARGWAIFLAFWLEKLQIAGQVIPQAAELGVMQVTLPLLEMPSIAPDAYMWLIAAIITAIALLVSVLLPQRFLPLIYCLRFAAAIQVSALVYFAVMPAAFPYSVSTYLNSLLTSGIWFMFVVPWVHGMIYYIFDFSVVQKAGLTLLTLAFIALALPFLLMTHAYLLSVCSLLILPLLYILCGVLLLTFACIALYGWAMSWSRTTRPLIPIGDD